MVSQFAGIKYKLDKSENFDEYMKALGVGMLTRKVGNSISPVVELVDNGDSSYTLKSSSTFKNTAITFKIGEEFQQETPDGRKVATVITQDGDNKLVEVQKGDKSTTIIREFSKDAVNMTLTIDSIVCTRNYKVVES